MRGLKGKSVIVTGESLVVDGGGVAGWIEAARTCGCD